MERPAESIFWFALLLIVSSAGGSSTRAGDPFVIVLGIAQDAGFPQAGCRRACCREVWKETERRRFPVSLGIVDPDTGERWMLDCSPAFPDQLRMLNDAAGGESPDRLSGILLTHAHIGHYTGLMHLGREVMGATAVPVFAMPRMEGFLRANGPWSQLVELENIVLQPLRDGQPVELNDRISVTPVAVPHRDEFSETVAFLITGPDRRVLYLPDIDKWDRWDVRIENMLTEVDVAYLDGTFFDGSEVPGRDISEIPHPFIVESLERFAVLPEQVRGRIRFLHLNHTNPALDPASPASMRVRRAGMSVARQGERVALGPR